jgi:hypothetical protein
MIRDERYALLILRDPSSCALYDTESDPGQTRAIQDAQPEVADELGGLFRAFAQAQRRPPMSFLDPDADPLPEPRPFEGDLPADVRRDLETLGYL